MYYYYYYYHPDSPESQYTVFRSHPIYPYLSVFLNKIFFIESEIVEDNRNLFSEVYELFEDEELKKFDFFKIPLNPSNENNSIISEINIKSNLTTEELELLKRFYSKQDFCKSYYQEFIKAIKDLFGFENIHQGGLLWFEPHIHGYKVIFMSAEKFISNHNHKNLKGTFLNRLDISKLLEKVNSEIENNQPKTPESKKEVDNKDGLTDDSPQETAINTELSELDLDIIIPSAKKMYSDFLQNAMRLMKSDSKKGTNLKEFILLLSTLNDITKEESRKDRKRLKHKIEIRDENAYYKIFVPGIEEEIKMTPAAKSLYFLALLELKGIRFNDLKTYQKEIEIFYKSFSNSDDSIKMQETITNISTKSKEVSTQKSRTKEHFMDVVCRENKILCEEIIAEFFYKGRTSDLFLDLNKKDIKGYESLFKFANGLNGFKI